MSQTPRHSVSVACVIFDLTGTRVLLIQRRDNGRWEPPGGVLELQESIEDGLRREVREETGVGIELDQLTGIYKNMERGIVSLVFRCTPLTEPALSTPEASAISWVPLDEVENLMPAAYAVRVLDASQPGVVQVRTHDGTSLLNAAHP